MAHVQMESNEFFTPMRTPSQKNRRKALTPNKTPKFSSPYEVVSLDSSSEDELRGKILQQDKLIKELRQLVKSQQQDLTITAGLNESVIIQTSNRISINENRIHQRDLALLENELEGKTKEISDLKKEIAELKKSIKELEASVEGKEKKLSEVSETKDFSTAKLGKYEKTIQELKEKETFISKELLARELKAREFETSVASKEKTWTEKMANLETSLERERANHEATKRDLKKVTADFKEASKTIEKYREILRKNDEEKSIKEVELRRSVEKELLEKSDAARATVLNEIKSLSTQIVSLTPSRAAHSELSLREQIGELKATKKFVEDQMEKVEEENKKLNKELDEVKMELNSMIGSADKATKWLYEENDKLRHQKADIRCELLAMKRDFDKLKEQENDFAKEKLNLEEKIGEVRRENREQVRQLLDNNDELDRKNTELIGKIASLNEELDVAELTKLENAQLKSDVARMKEKMLQLTDLLEQMDQKYADLIEERDRLDVKKKKYETLLRETMGKNRTLETNMEKTHERERELGLVKAENDRLKLKVNCLSTELRETHEDYRQELAILAKKAVGEKNDESAAAKLNDLKMEVGQKEAELRAAKRRVEELQEENRKLQTQYSDVIAREDGVVDENGRLRVGLADAVDKIEDYRRQVDQAGDLLDKMKAQLEEKKKLVTRLEDEVSELKETVAMKEGVESYLHSQINAKAMPKVGRRSTLLRTISETSMAVSVTSENIEDLENSKAKLMDLLEEKKRMVSAMRELQANKEDITRDASDSGMASMLAETQNIKKSASYSTHNSTVDSLTTRSNSSQEISVGSTAGNGGVGRMSHDIPHRWKELRHISVFSLKCVVCFVGIPTLGKAKRCVHCGVQVHSACAARVSNTCGLPDRCASYYLDNHTTVSEVETVSGRMNGWIRVYRDDVPTNCWVSTWAMMDETKISFYDNDGADLERPILQLDFHREQWVFRVGTEMPVKCDDQQYAANILHIKMPGRNLYLLPPSNQSARRWSECLQLAQKKHLMLTRRTSTIAEYSCLLTLVAPNNLKIHQTCVMDDWILLATQTGLYFTSLSQPRVPIRIAGVDSVFSLEVIPEANCACFITGSYRYLALVPLDALKQSLRSSQPAIRPDLLKNYQHLNIMIYYKCDNLRLLVLADSTKLHVLKHNPARDMFTSFGRLETKEPVQCLRPGKNGIFVGADTFDFVPIYANLATENLKSHTLVSSELSDYLLDIILLDNDEILLCYQNYGMFINVNGKQTRKDLIEWQNMPMEFVYTAPFLYVIHYDSIEILQIAEFNGPESRTIMEDGEVFQCKNAHVVERCANNDVIISIASSASTEIHRFNAVAGSKKNGGIKRRGTSGAASEKRYKF